MVTFIKSIPEWNFQRNNLASTHYGLYTSFLRSDKMNISLYMSYVSLNRYERARFYDARQQKLSLHDRLQSSRLQRRR